MIDYEADSPTISNLSTSKVEEVGKLAKSQIELEKEIVALEALLEAKDNALKLLAGNTIPELLATLGIAEIKLSDGSELKIDDVIACGISEAKKEKAHTWLEVNGFGSLIKKVCLVTLDRGDDKALDDLAKWLSLNKYEFGVEETVHYQTLKSFVKGQLESTDPNTVKPPFDLFGIFIAKKAVIENKEHKQPKRKYEKKKGNKKP